MDAKDNSFDYNGTNQGKPFGPSSDGAAIFESSRVTGSYLGCIEDVLMEDCLYEASEWSGTLLMKYESPDISKVTDKGLTPKVNPNLEKLVLVDDGRRNIDYSFEANSTPGRDLLDLSVSDRCRRILLLGSDLSSGSTRSRGEESRLGLDDTPYSGCDHERLFESNPFVSESNADNNIETDRLNSIEIAYHVPTHICPHMSDLDVDMSIIIESLNLERLLDAYVYIITTCSYYGIIPVLTYRLMRQAASNGTTTNFVLEIVYRFILLQNIFHLYEITPFCDTITSSGSVTPCEHHKANWKQKTHSFSGGGSRPEAGTAVCKLERPSGSKMSILTHHLTRKISGLFSHVGGIDGSKKGRTGSPDTLAEVIHRVAEDRGCIDKYTRNLVLDRCEIESILHSVAFKVFNRYPPIYYTQSGVTESNNPTYSTMVGEIAAAVLSNSGEEANGTGGARRMENGDPPPEAEDVTTFQSKGVKWQLAVDNAPKLAIRYKLQNVETLLDSSKNPKKQKNSSKAASGGPLSGSLIWLKVEGQIDCNILDVLSVMYEVDLYTTWIPYFTIPVKLGLRESHILHRSARVNFIALFKIDFPWPMQNRDACVEVWVADDLEARNRIIVYIGTCRARDADMRYGTTVPEPAANTCRLDVEGCMILEPLSGNMCRTKSCWKVLPGVSVSQFLLDFATKVFTKSSFESFGNVCKGAGSPKSVYYERRRNNPWVYKFLEYRVLDVRSYKHLLLNDEDIDLDDDTNKVRIGGSASHVERKGKKKWGVL